MLYKIKLAFQLVFDGNGTFLGDTNTNMPGVSGCFAVRDIFVYCTKIFF